MLRSSVGRGAASLLTLLLLLACRSGAEDGAREFQLEPEYGIGQVEGPPEYALGQIGLVLPMSDGGFLTCDYNDYSLRRYDPSGRFLHGVGRRGRGPGEYNSCGDTELLGDSLIVVNDPSNGRFAFFRADGTFDRVLAIRIWPGFGGGRTFFFADTAGLLWTRGARKTATPPTRAEGEFGRTQFVIVDPLRGPVDSVLVPGGGGSARGLGFVLSTPDGLHEYVPADTVWAVTATGTFVVAGTDAYRISVRPAHGPEREITREVAPVPYGEDERAEWNAWREYFSKKSPGFAPAAIPEWKPVIRSLRVDDAGRIWVQPHVAAEYRERPPRPAGDPRPMLHWLERNSFDLFDLGSGAFLGRLTLPPATRLLATQGDRVWLAEEGSEGEQVIGVHRLRTSASGR